MMNMKHIIAALSITLTLPVMAKDVVKGVAVPLEYATVKILKQETAKITTDEFEEKPHLVRLFGINSYGAADEDQRTLIITFYDLLGFNNGVSKEVSCTMVDSDYYGNNESGTCTVDGKDLGEQLILSGWYTVDRNQLYRKGMSVELAKRYEAAEQNARENKLGIWKKLP